jgi:signal transduction histidine kinase
MQPILDFIVLLFQQVAGGPGPIENNLIRFGLAAVLWGVLLLVAWSRQRTGEYPREKLLVWGFGLFMARELYMFIQVAFQVAGNSSHVDENILHHPIEHSLAMAATIVVAGAFLRYVLDDEKLSRRFLQIGLGVTAICFLIASVTWPTFHAQNPELHFHHTWQAWIFHLPLCVFILAAIFFLARERSWLSRTVMLALSFFFVSEVFILVNFATDNAYNAVICPVGNFMHILAIPILGFVYLREQSIEKEEAETELKTYRDQLEDLVEERTAELSAVNSRLQQEILVRQRAEAEIVQRNARLAALNAVAATISQSLELEPTLNTALEMALSVLEMEVGAIFLFDPHQDRLVMKASRGDVPLDRLSMTENVQFSCIGISYEAVAEKQAVLHDLSGSLQEQLTAYIANQDLKTIVSTPLLLKGTAVGALTLGSKNTGVIGQSELELMTAIGQQIGMAVENARLYQDSERYAGELALLHDVSLTLTSTLDVEKIYNEIARQSTRLLDCQIAGVLQRNQVGQDCEIVSSAGMEPQFARDLIQNSEECQMLEELASSRETIAINDARHDQRVPAYWVDKLDVRTVLCLPIWTNQEPLEFLLLIDRRETRLWLHEDLKLIESFVNRAALALENAYLHKQLEWAAALEERQRIAADMHDGLAQTLSLLGLRVDKTSELLERNIADETIRELQSIRDTIGQASIEVRRSISSLSETPAPVRALQDQLSDVLNQVCVDDLGSARLVMGVTEPIYLPPEQTAQVLPIAQEALLNACCHAQASSISLSLERAGDRLKISIEDDGVGFDLLKTRRGNRDHFGLSIMRARANRIGGRLDIDSQPGQGTRVSLTWDPEGADRGSRSGLEDRRFEIYSQVPEAN